MHTTPSRPARLLALAALSSLVACASSGERPAPASPAPSAEAASSATPSAPAPSASAPAPKGFPTTCADPGQKECTPDAAFAKVACERGTTAVALALFAQGTPFTRLYLTRKTAAWNASGGSSANDELAADEEVVVLRARDASSSGGVTVSGQGTSYDALRWNGDCVTLSSGEVTTQRPARPRHPRILWNKIDDEMRTALREDPAVDDAARAMKKECKGVTMGDVTKACEVADGKLVDAIVKHVREGGKVATPKFP